MRVFYIRFSQVKGIGWKRIGVDGVLTHRRLIPLVIGFMLLLLSTPLHQRAASRVQHPNYVAANSLSPQVARKGSTLSGFVQRSRLEREVGRDLHSNKWEEV